ncbi:MAG: hypothetical protein J6T22_04450 [Bacteroidales bacterium]|nr:hypothetical protein [Bacteroidales bacterium]
MPRRLFILIGMVVLLGFTKAEAQNVVFDTVGNTLITADTIVKQQKPTKTAKAKKTHSPTKATIMSACLPGLGQIYNRNWWKVPIVYAGLGGLGYLAYSNYSEYRSYLHAYEFKTGDLPEGTSLSQHETDLANKYADSQLQTYKEAYRRDFEFYSILTVAWYGLNILDACVDGHLYTYDISDDLSLSIDPYLRSAESPIKTPHYAQVGLSFQLNF